MTGNGHHIPKTTTRLRAACHAIVLADSIPIVGLADADAVCEDVNDNDNVGEPKEEDMRWRGVIISWKTVGEKTMASDN